MSLEFIAFERATQGSSASRRLRHAGRVPAIVYGAGLAPQSIEVDHVDMYHSLKKPAFRTSLLNMKIGEKTELVMLRDIQVHPYKPKLLHLDFQRIDPNQKLTKKVAFSFVDLDLSPAVKAGSAINHVTSELEITCLPKDLPSSIEVNLATLSAGHAVHLKDITLPEGVVAVLHGKDDLVIVTAIGKNA
jgi:large subunit ribosomal protein L25